MNTAGYSGTPLAKKLGIREGFRIRLFNAPPHYLSLFGDMPEKVIFLTDKKSSKDLVHYFAKNLALLEKDIISLRNEIFPNGAIWVSWPKKSARIETDVTENLIRNIALHNGLVDIKVCAVDETWSALKLVIPLKDRKLLVANK